LAADVQIPMQKHKKFENPRQHNSSKLKNSTVTNTNDSEVNAISDKDFFKKKLS
jgi:hypothetical protein